MIKLAYFLMLLLALTCMLSMTFFAKKRIEHILFAVFCGSLAMVAVRTLSADLLGPYQYIVGFGACATCNAVWLISIALFRENNGKHAGLTGTHYWVAASIASLVIINNSMELMYSLNWLTVASSAWLDRALSEITQMLSSTVLLLTFWEAIRGYPSCDHQGKLQRKIFATSFFSGVFACSVIGRGIVPEHLYEAVFPWLVVCAASAIMLATLTVIILQYKARCSQATPVKIKNKDRDDFEITHVIQECDALIQDIEILMKQKQLYLRPELKIIDVANQLNVPEYRVSRAIRHNTHSPNFNHYVNTYRLSHAKRLLLSEESKTWSILVISMECGFASLAPFNRAFKAQEGCTPNQYRNKQTHDECAMV